MCHFLQRRKWSGHVDGHVQALEREEQRAAELHERKHVPGPEERCAILFGSVRDLQFHIQNVHCTL